MSVALGLLLMVTLVRALTSQLAGHWDSAWPVNPAQQGPAVVSIAWVGCYLQDMHMRTAVMTNHTVGCCNRVALAGCCRQLTLTSTQRDQQDGHGSTPRCTHVVGFRC